MAELKGTSADRPAILAFSQRSVTPRKDAFATWMWLNPSVLVGPLFMATQFEDMPEQSDGQQADPMPIA